MTHMSDLELLMDADGELMGSSGAEARRHIADCVDCQARQAELLQTLGAATDEHLKQELPPLDGARALLQSRLRATPGQRYWALGALAAALLLLLFQWTPERSTEASPRSELTPGAIRAVGRADVCAGDADRPAIAKTVAMDVFRKYGIHDPLPRAYEVDYLIPADLGGSEDPRNLWPQPYNAGTWNARVKDALEDRLRTMVCTGSLDLTTAQQEIAVDWIGAYKKHFQTREPLPDHFAFVKDQPWE